MPDVAVRRARPEDIPQVIALHERCWRISYAGLADADAKFARGVEEWARLWGEILDRTRVVELHGAVAGFVVFGPSRDADAAEGSGEIQALYVDPDAQGAGLGAALVAQARAELGRRGLRARHAVDLPAQPGLAGVLRAPRVRVGRHGDARR